MNSLTRRLALLAVSAAAAAGIGCASTDDMMTSSSGTSVSGMANPGGSSTASGPEGNPTLGLGTRTPEFDGTNPYDYWGRVAQTQVAETPAPAPVETTSSAGTSTYTPEPAPVVTPAPAPAPEPAPAPRQVRRDRG